MPINDTKYLSLIISLRNGTQVQCEDTTKQYVQIKQKNDSIYLDIHFDRSQSIYFILQSRQFCLYIYLINFFRAIFFHRSCYNWKYWLGKCRGLGRLGENKMSFNPATWSCSDDLQFIYVKVII